MNIEKETHWYTFDTAAVLKKLETSLQGLTSEQAKDRLVEFGANELLKQKPDTLIAIFLRQFQSPLLYILMLAAVAAFILGANTDALIIVFVLLFNGVVGAFQEGKAQSALLALNKFTETESLVLRDNRSLIIPSADLVVGDIVVLKAGDKVPADIRLIESNGLLLNEAVLTGESGAISKNSQVLPTNNIDQTVLIHEQKNILFKGTHIHEGSGRGVVIRTGIHTEIGKISQTLHSIDTDIPLKASIARLARGIIVAVSIIIALLFVIGLLTGNTPREMLLVSIALMVSVIPEGLPIVLTLILAKGVKRMSEKNVLVKRLQAVEALGQAKVIAVDKTGTLTKNELVVQKVYCNDKTFDITGVGYDPDGEALSAGIVATDSDEIQYIARLCGLSANAQVFRGDEETKVTGDPTEAALLVFGEKFGYEKQALLTHNPLLSEIPFDYKKKFYVNIHKTEKGNILIDTGAPEVVITQCTHRWTPEGPVLLTDKDKHAIDTTVQEMSADGLRVIAVAIREQVPDTVEERDLEKLVLVGLCGMKDALREEVADAMEQAQRAGMRVVMITGDHVATATAIAHDAGIFHEGDAVLSGTEINELSDEDLVEAITGVTVFARVTPEHKLRIIKAYEKTGDIIAMTGDGVNDVPSLLAANLGVAMGRLGTEVAKEAADIILLDDNFGNIPRAVEEGRNIYATIKKTLLYLFSTNLAELLVIVAAVIALLPVPLTPAQIVWLNLVTDSFLVMTLAFLPHDPDLLFARFEKPSKYILNKMALIRLVLFAVIITIGTLGVFLVYKSVDVALARTMAFITLSLYQIFRLWSVRSTKHSVFSENPLNYPWMLVASLLAIGLQLFAIYMPFMQGLLGTVPMTGKHWMIAILVGFSIVIVDEIRKVFVRRSVLKAY